MHVIIYFVEISDTVRSYRKWSNSKIAANSTVVVERKKRYRNIVYVSKFIIVYFFFPSSRII